MSTPEPPAPTPSATTANPNSAPCHVCAMPRDNHIYEGRFKYHRWTPVPPASAPAATAEVWTCRDCGKRFTDVSDAFRHEEAQRHHVGPAAPTGEEAETPPQLTLAQRCIVGRLAHLLTGAEDGTPIPWDDLLPAAERLTAQATELAALRALLQRVVEPHDGQSHAELCTDIRAALAPHQTTGDEHG